MIKQYWADIKALLWNSVWGVDLVALVRTRIAAEEPSPAPAVWRRRISYAVAAALVGRAIRAKKESDPHETFGHILEFAGTFPQREMGVMLVSDMYRAIGQDIFSVPQFSKWANIVADVMLYES